MFHLSTPKFSNNPFTTVLTPNNVVEKPSPLGELKARNSTCSLLSLAKQFKELPATCAEFNWKTVFPIPIPSGSNVNP